MLKLDSLVNALPKVGPKYKVLLEKLEIHKINDLLYHFPFRYDDYSQIKNISDIIDGETVTLNVLLGSISNIFTKNGKRLTRAKIIDNTGQLDVIWFNQHYLTTTLKTGERYFFSGKVVRFNNKLSLVAPEVEEATHQTLHTGRLVPIYPETAGVSSKWLRSRINDVTSKITENETDLEEFLPEKTLNKKHLPEIKTAMPQIHFPDSDAQKDSARKRFAFEELFLELLNVEKRKKEWSHQLEGPIFKPYKKEIEEFLSKLPFTLTESQNKSALEIIEDLQQSHPMNRLLEGDVGTGKTVVAVIAAYLAWLNGLKVLYMAPTEILASQHYETFSKLLKSGPTVALVTGSSKPQNDWDILIGTHAILFNKEPYKDIGLVIVDEQHRFGVEQRGKIIELGKSSHDQGKTPHFLTMTATPIPRTLALTLYGDLEISHLKTHPNAQRKISTKVVPDSGREDAYKWIRQKNEPCFIVCPLIETSESLSLENVKAAQHEFERLKKGTFNGVPMGLLHGKMKPKEKQEIVEQFRQGKLKVLVSTPVIEVGIDIPDATIIVIESAERYGLASLHQLRGRVGRGNKEGFCFAVMSTQSRSAFERLKNLEKIDNGLELAEIDMRMRGIGDIFGTMQHGFKKFKIASLYDTELLEEAKTEAQLIFKELDAYPKLQERIAQLGEFIRNN